MIYGVQLLGILFALIMLYFTFLYYKRESYGRKGLILWMLVWLFFLVMVMFPQTIYGIMETLQIQRTVDFFVIGGFLFFSLIIFHLYISVKSVQKDVEVIVREIALSKLDTKNNKNDKK